ncbi:hypothetical protein ACHQM5_020663 [Ranunculus cassubicifolius]
MNKNFIISLLLVLLIMVTIKGSDASSIQRMSKLPISPAPAPIIHTKSDNIVKPDSSSNEIQVEERCEASTNCVNNMITACIKHSNTGPRDYIILIQNEGEGELIVKVVVPAYVEVSTKELKILGHQVKKVNASITVGEGAEILVNAGDGDCVLRTGGVAVSPKGNNLFQNYANQATPIHGAYFMFVVAVIIGGTWACCKLGKKGYSGGGDHQYQEVEMALPESTPGAQDGWEQGWDDDWDEEGAVLSPSKGVGNPSSSNGLTSRSLNKEDGWENDWDS